MEETYDLLAPRKVQKRDGRIVPFDRYRIERAIYKAFQAVGEETASVPEELSKIVTTKLFEKFGPDATVNIETIQDFVEETLIENGFSKVAKAYILYRRKRQELRDRKSVV